MMMMMMMMMMISQSPLEKQEAHRPRRSGCEVCNVGFQRSLYIYVQGGDEVEDTDEQGICKCIREGLLCCMYCFASVWNNL